MGINFFVPIYDEKNPYDNFYDLPDYVSGYIKLLERTFPENILLIRPMTIKRQISFKLSLAQNHIECFLNYDLIEDAMEYVIKPKKKTIINKIGIFFIKIGNGLNGGRYDN